MGWISIIKEKISKKKFLGYSSKDIQDILNYIHYDKNGSLADFNKSMDLRLISFLKELITCLNDKKDIILQIYEIEIGDLLTTSHIVNRTPNISNITHVPNWIVVLFVPFNKLPLYINLQSDLYRSLVAWRLKRGR